MNRYQNGKIYKLVNDVDNEIYVGSTCLQLSKRKSKHRSNASRNTEQRVYRHLNEIGWHNVHIVLVESFPCNNKMELEKRERYHIDMLKPTLNKNKPCMTYDDMRTRQTIYDREVRNKIRHQCIICKTDVIDQPYYIKRHERTSEHTNNMLEHMKDVIKQYKHAQPIEIQSFSLEH